MRELERRVVLSVLDRKWREHLYEMDYLQEGIGLRAMAQRDPLVEYQREGASACSQAMMDAIKEESVGYLFSLEVQVEATPAEAEAGSRGGGGPGARAGGQGLGDQRPAQPLRPPWTAGGVEVHGEGGARSLPAGGGGRRQPGRAAGAAQKRRAEPRLCAQPISRR